MKKIAIVCCMLLVAAALVTGSIAFFTDSVESNQNVVAAGTLDIEQHEYERKKENGSFVQNDGKYALNAYTQNQPVYPSGISAADFKAAEQRKEYAVKAASDDVTAPVYQDQISLFDGIGFVDKIVTVENVGTLICHVRTFVAMPAYQDDEGKVLPWLHLDLNQAAITLPDGSVANQWIWEEPFLAQIKDEKGGDAQYYIYKGTYQQPVQPGEFTAPSLLGFCMDSNVNNDGQTLTYKVNGKAYPLMSTKEPWHILVKSEASQAIVFDGVNAAMEATFIWDETENYHPWKNESPWATQNP